MFFSRQEFYRALNAYPHVFPWSVRAACINSIQYGTYSKSKAYKVLKCIKDSVSTYRSEAVLDRANSVSLWKFTRPWEIIPELRHFTAPEGDFSVGVEVEFGFRHSSYPSQVIKYIRNWRHITIDREGGNHGLEVTFPPVLYSKLTSKHNLFKYIKLLKEHHQLLVNHSRNSHVGTHVNVGAHVPIPNEVQVMMVEALRNLSNPQKIHYFGRIPYGYLYNQGKFIEYKLFNSVTDVDTVKRYVNIAVSLTKLMRDVPDFTHAQLIEALDRGYAGRIPLN